MFRDLALVEDDMFCRVDTGGEKGGGHFADIARQFQRVLRHGDRVQIDNAIDAFHLVLQRDEAFDGTEIIAQMQIAGGLDAGKHPGRDGGRCVHGPGRVRPYRGGLWGLAALRRNKLRQVAVDAAGGECSTA